MSEWMPIETAPRDEEVLLGHNPKWAAPLPIYWSEYHGEWMLEGRDIGGVGKRYGIMLASQPTHWDYCPLPPAT